MDELDRLIDDGKEVMSTAHGSPRYDLWKHDAHNYIEKNYGADLVAMFDRIIRPSQVHVMGEDPRVKRNQRLQRAIDFIEELKDRDANSDLANSTPTESLEDARQAVQTRFDRAHITVSGNATFGDNSPLNEIYISEFLTALIEEAEKLPESDEKKELIQSLKSALENPTLASVAGGFVGGAVQGLVN